MAVDARWPTGLHTPRLDFANEDTEAKLLSRLKSSNRALDELRRALEIEAGDRRFSEAGLNAVS